MGHATAEKVERQLGEVEATGEEVAEVLYRAKGRNFRAIRVPRRRWVENGEIQTSDGISYDFAPSGEFRTTDAGAVAYLERLPTFNLEFWRVGSEPGAVPSPEAIQEAVMEAATEFNDDKLAELERDEATTYQREMVLKLIRAARRRVQGAIAEVPKDDAA